MDNPEKLATWGTQYEGNTTQYVLDITMRKQTENVNKTWTLLQTTEWNYEPNIVVRPF
jgi:hypothetical protein